MLAEARGYHFGMVLAHQNLTQMPRDTQLALSANARNKIFFSCAPEDAHQLARHTMPELSEHDLSHMDAFRAAARLVVDGRETPVFTLRTNPPRPIVGEATAVRHAAATIAARFSGKPASCSVAWPNRRSHRAAEPSARRTRLSAFCPSQGHRYALWRLLNQRLYTPPAATTREALDRSAGLTGP